MAAILVHATAARAALTPGRPSGSGGGVVNSHYDQAGTRWLYRTYAFRAELEALSHADDDRRFND